MAVKQAGSTAAKRSGNGTVSKRAGSTATAVRSGKTAAAKRSGSTAKRKKTASSTAAASAKRRKHVSRRSRQQPHYREICGVIFFLIPALCVGVSYFHFSAIAVDLITYFSRALLGYGYWTLAVFLLLGFRILTAHHGRTVAGPLLCTLLLPAVCGALGHLWLVQTPVTNAGFSGMIPRLLASGGELQSGGILGGIIAETLEIWLSKPVGVILLVLAFVWLLLGALRETPRSLLERLRSIPRYEYVEEVTRPLPARRRKALPAPDTEYTQLDIPLTESDVMLDEIKHPKPRFSLSGIAAKFTAVLRTKTASGTTKADKPVRRKTKPGKKPGRKKLPENVNPENPEEIPPQERLTVPEENNAAQSDAGTVPPENAPEQTVIETMPEVSENKPVRGKSRRKQPDTVEQKHKNDVAEEAGRSLAETPGEYRGPSVDRLLKKGPAVDKNKIREETDKVSISLARTLRSFGVNAEPVGQPVAGPSVTRYDFQLRTGTKLSKITGLADDIALAHGWERVRIAPIPNRSSVVGIEAPNRQPVPVFLLDVLKAPEFLNNPSPTAFALGKDISGRNIVGSVERLPHILIAGTTGSGKSVCMNCLIVSMLCKSGPDRVRFIMIDPKMVELAPYNGIPHLLVPVVTDPKKAAGALQWAVSEMLKRYKIFSESGVKKLEEYNRLAREKKVPASMPVVVVVIDELADLMTAAAKEVEEAIMRVAQMGRAAGIHLVIATQRPSADIITGLMKANIPSRIAFAVASSLESRIILDTTGAEKLVGRGDMLYAPLGESRLRVQGCYISPEEIDRIVSDVKQKNGAEQYDTAVRDTIDASVKAPEPEPVPMEETDELLSAALNVVLETGQASTSMLQRRLKVGYGRAARLIDQMESRGYVGPFEGSKPRQVLITKEQLQSLNRAAPVHDAAKQ